MQTSVLLLATLGVRDPLDASINLGQIGTGHLLISASRRRRAPLSVEVPILQILDSCLAKSPESGVANSNVRHPDFALQKAAAGWKVRFSNKGSHEVDTRLLYLQDREEIDTILSTYCRGIDRHDVDLINSAYFPDAHDNHGPFRNMVSEGFPEWANALHAERTRAHLHNLTTKSVQIDGDVALADTYVIFTLYMRESEETQFGFGRYIDRLERRDGRWRIADRQTTIDIRMRGDANCYAVLNQGTTMSAGAYPQGKWDREDLSYKDSLELPEEQLRQLERKGARPEAGAPVPARGFEDVDLSGEALLERLYDRQLIADLIADGLRGIDRQSSSLALQHFSPNAKVKLLTGELDAQDFVEAEISGAAEDITQARNITTHLVSFGESGAAAETYVIEMRRRINDRDVWVAGIRMLDRLARDGSGWKVEHRTLVRDWEFLSRGSNFNRADQYLRSTKDPTDLRKTDPVDQGEQVSL